MRTKVLLAFMVFVAGFLFGAFVFKPIVAEKDARSLSREMSEVFYSVVRKVEPSVVSVRARYRAASEIAFSSGNQQNDKPDERLYRERPFRANYAVGSGFIVEKSGYVLTNYHVVENAIRVVVTLQNGEEYPAKLVGADEETDLAVLKIDAKKELPTVIFGDSDSVQIGEWVLAIGSPFGLDQSVTAGIVSQVKRETPFASPFQRFIQTDAAINRGNSGGPLVNMNAEVIGVNSQIATLTGNFSGVGFALPSKEAIFVYRQIIQHGRVRRGYLGVNLDSVRSEFAKVYGLESANGAIITNVAGKDTPAGRAGLQVGDVIIGFNDEKVQNAHDLIMKIATVEPEKEVKITYLRENSDSLERREAVVKLGERPSTRVSVDEERPKRSDISPFGLVLSDLTPSLAKTYNYEGEKGVLVKEVDASSFLNDLRISSGADLIGRGDLIQRVNRQQVTDIRSFNEIAGRLKPGDAVVMHVAGYNRRTQSIQKRIIQFTVQQ
ncbi:MAG: trypsin-like peptidase domain-containing protein [Pyrinomonadaceae bacterium]|nr:trypsin-like peptidase domain-containing protein [Pyrinomonadaceae bacterium]MCX7639141.1 trypsin-like peptidase domain-containing protein [Pyrinomonadaceae bacterium]MDW8303638.1 trypsin-like peptidase domain-containing protein [Acidobacteriota bacterium]